MQITLNQEDLRPIVQKIMSEMIGCVNQKVKQPDTNSTCLLLPAREAAKALSVCEKSLWNFTKPRGTIPMVKIGARTLYDPRDLQAWIDEQKQEGSAE